MHRLYIKLKLALLCLFILLPYQNCSFGPVGKPAESKEKPFERQGNGGGYDLKGFTGLFPINSIWSKDISAEPLDPQSAETIAWMDAGGNWGANQLAWRPSGNLRLSTELHINYTDAQTPRLPFEARPDFMLPDCDLISSFPLPVGGSLSGTRESSGYWQCASSTDENCQLIVVDRQEKKMYLSYKTDVSEEKVTSQCAIVWDLSKVYPPDGRGDQCTSADSTGLPTGALLFSADDLAAGHIDHALRFSLPNTRIREWVYVHPATHGTGNLYGQSGPTEGASAPSPAPIRGARFRLKASYNISPYLPAIQVILRALQKYGMILGDGGDLSLDAASDANTTAKYADLGITDPENVLSFLKVTDFEVVDGGERIPITQECVRNGE